MTDQSNNVTKAQLGEPMSLLGYSQEYTGGVIHKNINDSKTLILPEDKPRMGVCFKKKLESQF